MPLPGTPLASRKFARVENAVKESVHQLFGDGIAEAASLKHQIPVLRLGGQLELAGRISEKELMRMIRALMKEAK
jgi:hypothetical protein